MKKVHIKFLQRNYSEINKCEIAMPLCGSDSICHVDNRLTIRNMIIKGYQRAKQLERVQPHIIGFQILDRNGNELKRIITNDRAEFISSPYYN
jgi:hypothetical protein